MLVSSQILGLALQFSFVPLHGLMAGTRGSLGRNYPLLILQLWHPVTVSEPTSSLKPGECPPWLLPLDAHVAGWRHGPLSPGARAHDTAHAANGATGPASCGPTRAHYAIPTPLGPLAY